MFGASLLCTSLEFGITPGIQVACAVPLRLRSGDGRQGQISKMAVDPLLPLRAGDLSWESCCGAMLDMSISVHA
jgi:hypothetical protein